MHAAIAVDPRANGGNNENTCAFKMGAVPRGKKKKSAKYDPAFEAETAERNLNQKYAAQPLVAGVAGQPEGAATSGQPEYDRNDIKKAEKYNRLPAQTPHRSAATSNCRISA